MPNCSAAEAAEGSPGQGNYSAANAALDGHARYWKQVQEDSWHGCFGKLVQVR